MSQSVDDSGGDARTIDLRPVAPTGPAAANGDTVAPAPEPPVPDEHHADVGQMQDVARAVLTPLFRFFWRIRTEGLEHVPAAGPAILAPNHTSVIDSFFLPCVLPRGITFVGKAEYLDDWKTRHLFPALGMIPIDRSGGDAAQRALNTAARVLDRGGLFGIYPEGTRSRTGKLHRGHTGVARLALRCRAPIVPVGVLGTRDIQPPDAKAPRPFMNALVRFGRPIDVSRYADRVDDRLLLRQITDEVMYEIRELTGQDYVDTYATRSPEAAPAPVAAPSVERPRRSSADVLAARAG
jgi:1-acyl-sn-glycerol-3-phosphate acyltransferase